MKYLRLSVMLTLLIGTTLSCDQPNDTTATRTTSTSIPDAVIIPIEQARQMVANYAPRAGYVERDGQLLPNTRSIWFDLDVIEAFVARLRQEQASGIRFYLAAYNDDYSNADPDQNIPPNRYWGYNTLLLVPTLAGAAGGFQHDYLMDGNTDNGRVLTAPPIVNRGELSPPDTAPDPLSISE